MNNLIFVSLGVAAVLLIVFVGLTTRYRRQVVPNYRAMFVIGILFIPLALSTNLGLLAMGVVFSAVGWRNRDKWGQHTQWTDYPPALKKLKLIFAGGVGALVISVGLFLIIANGQ